MCRLRTPFCNDRFQYFFKHFFEPFGHQCNIVVLITTSIYNLHNAKFVIRAALMMTWWIWILRLPRHNAFHACRNIIRRVWNVKASKANRSRRCNLSLFSVWRFGGETAFQVRYTLKYFFHLNHDCKTTKENGKREVSYFVKAKRKLVLPFFILKTWSIQNISSQRTLLSNVRWKIPSLTATHAIDRLLARKLRWISEFVLEAVLVWKKFVRLDISDHYFSAGSVRK